ncbi:MAG: hypothetical protein IKU84_05035 [Clostridia bacterium]|nr:hypothetical protein [Clostridia bacterium]
MIQKYTFCGIGTIEFDDEIMNLPMTEFLEWADRKSEEIGVRRGECVYSEVFEII